MSWAERVAPVGVGDTVAYSKRWLQSTGQYTGDVPQARGRVTGIKVFGDLVLADIEWDKPDIPERVNVRNLSRVVTGQVMERD